MNPSPTDTAAIVAAFHVSAQLAADISRAVGLPGAHSDPANLSRLLAHDFRRKLEEAERALADVLPPVKASDARDLANNDRTLAAEVEAWRDRMFESADVSDMHRDTLTRETPDDEEWEIVRGSSRFEVREVPRYSTRKVGDDWKVHDFEDNSDASPSDSDYLDGTAERVEAYTAMLNERDGSVFVVVDTSEYAKDGPGGYADARDGDELSEVGREDYDPTDEDDAKSACEAVNLEDYRTNAAGWPWANNTGWKIDERDVDDFDTAGFVVARFDGGDLWAGLDSGGYDFTDAHWAPLYLRRAAANGWYVRTDAGLRRVVA
jgi:hypothetical protein